MIYLVRHGQTEFNLARRYQGALDSRLTALGVRQAQAVGRLLATLVPADCPMVASPQGRALRTAELIRETAGLTGAFATDDRLREVSLGVWDGMTDEDVEFVYPGARAGTTRYDWFFASPDGDRYGPFAARLREWLAEQAEGSGPLICVSHGVASRVLRGLYLGMEAEAALKQEVPQDAIFRLQDGGIERIATDAAAAGV